MQRPSCSTRCVEPEFGASRNPGAPRSGGDHPPLLFARRSEIVLFAEDQGIHFRLDSSNESTEYRRNYLRHNVIPAIEASKEFDFVTSLNRLSRLMRQLDNLLSTEVRQLLPGMLTRDEWGTSSVHISRFVPNRSICKRELCWRC